MPTTCSVNIVSVMGVPGPSGGPPLTSLSVSGTSSDCPVPSGATAPQILVVIQCGQLPPLQQTVNATPATGGTPGLFDWTATWTSAELGNWPCGCGDQIVVRAYCAADTACRDVQLAATIGCCACWTVSVTQSLGSCNSDGTVDVTFTATLTPPAGCACAVAGYWVCDITMPPSAGTPLTKMPGYFNSPCTVGGAPTTQSWTCTYKTPHSYTAQLVLTSPPDCEPISIPVTLTETCPVCPTITGIDSTVDACDSSGKRPIHLTANVSGSYTSVSWTLPDGSMTTTSPDPGSPSTSTLNPGSYSPAGSPYTFTATVHEDGCPVVSQNKTVPVAPCEGPPPPPPPGGCCLCSILLTIALASLAAGVAMAFVIGCDLASGVTAMSIIGLIVAAAAAFVVFVIFIYLWGHYCARTQCDTLSMVIWTVQVLIAASVAATAALAAAKNPCFLGALFDAGYLGFALVFLIDVANRAGCPIPSITKPPPPLTRFFHP